MLLKSYQQSMKRVFLTLFIPSNLDNIAYNHSTKNERNN